MIPYDNINSKACLYGKRQKNPITKEFDLVETKLGHIVALTIEGSLEDGITPCFVVRHEDGTFQSYSVWCVQEVPLPNTDENPKAHQH